MAAGPFLPHSAVPVTAGRVFPNIHVGAGANSKEDDGLGVEASLGADSIWRLRFQIPPVIPAGTTKLFLKQISNVGGIQVVKFNPKWTIVGDGENPSTAVLSAEGTQTLSLVAGDADAYKQVKVTLDARAAPAAGDELKEIVMDLVFETAGWTLAVVSTWIVSVIWE